MTGKPEQGFLRFSILTPCLNAERTIREAVTSVRRQDYPNLEHIVLDGGSKDGTLAALAAFPELRIISEPDDGSHDAMNKGLRLATGDIIGFLNTDDIYADGLLPAVGEAFTADAELDVVVVGTVVFEEDATGARRVLVARDHRVESGFRLAELAFGAPGFNGRFYRRRLFDRIGDFEVGYDFSADRHFLTRIALSGAKSRTLPRFGYFFRSHPGSRTLDAARRNAGAFAREHMREALIFARSTTHTEQRRLFLAWHAFSGTKLAYLEARNGRLGESIATIARLSSADPLWPLRLAFAFALRRAVRAAEARSTAAYQNPFG